MAWRSVTKATFWPQQDRIPRVRSVDCGPDGRRIPRPIRHHTNGGFHITELLSVVCCEVRAGDQTSSSREPGARRRGRSALAQHLSAAGKEGVASLHAHLVFLDDEGLVIDPLRHRPWAQHVGLHFSCGLTRIATPRFWPAFCPSRSIAFAAT